jgi:hypothetical protein
MVAKKVGEFGIDEFECLLCHKLFNDMLKIKKHLVEEHKINPEKLYFYWWCVVEKN